MLHQLANSPVWFALTVACSIFSLYMAVRETANGNTVDGTLYLVVLIVLAANSLSRD